MKILVIGSHSSVAPPAIIDVFSRGDVVPVFGEMAILGVEYDCLNEAQANALSDAQLLANYYAALIPLAYYHAWNLAGKALQDWINGTKPIPVVIASVGNMYNMVNDPNSINTGASGDTDISGNGYFETTSYLGGKLSVKGAAVRADMTCRYASTLVAADVASGAVVNRLWQADGKSLWWTKTNGSGGSTVDYMNISCPMMWVGVCHERAGLLPPKPFYYTLANDDIEEVEADGDGNCLGLVDLITWAKTPSIIKPRGAAIQFGLDDLSIMPAHASELLLNPTNWDVCKFNVHEATLGYWGNLGVDGTYDTVEKKLTAHRAAITARRAAGYPIEDTGMVAGHYYIPQNTATELGYKALAKSGCKLLRTTPDSNILKMTGSKFIYREGDTRYAFDTHMWRGGHLDWDGKTVADAYLNGIAEQQQRNTTIAYAFNSWRRLYHQRTIYGHGPNLCLDAVQGWDNPMMYYLRMVEDFMELCGGCLQFASYEVMQQMTAEVV
jgi:hypothetical protein